MFNPSYISSSGSKLHLEGVWSLPSSIRLGGCSSPDFDVQDLPLLVSNPISSPSPIGIPTSSFTTFDPSGLSFSHVAIRLQDFQDHEPYPPVIDLFDSQSDPPCKKKSIRGKVAKKSCDKTRKFQIEWVAKMPWAEGIVSQDGLINLVKCRVCSLVERKKKS